MARSPAESRMDYIREHGIHVLLESVMAKLLDARPDKPIDFMINELHLRRKQKLKINVGVFGLDNAGKTTLIGAMSGNPVMDPVPTVGFSFEEFVSDEHTTHVYDLGGGRNIRDVWPSYFGDIHAAIFVVDAADEDRFEEAANALRALRSHYRADGKPTLVVANKRDNPSCVSPSAFVEAFGLPPSSLPDAAKRDADLRVECVSATADPPDAGIDSGLEWLLERVRRVPSTRPLLDPMLVVLCVLSVCSVCVNAAASLQVRARYADLDHRVRWQTAEAQAAQKEARRLRAERVAQMVAEEEAAAAAAKAEESGEAVEAEAGA